MSIIPKAGDLQRTALNPIDEAKKQYATAISIDQNIPYDQAMLICERILTQKIQQPTVVHYHRNDNGDREERKCTMSEYLELASDKILSPTFTQYYTSEQKPSMMAKYVSNNLKMRTFTKKKMFKAYAEGDTARGIRLDFEQANWKSNSNDVTGLFRSMGSAIYNPSCHTTLTSLSRIATSTNNGSGERLLQGRRHYHTYEVTINNIISIVSNLRDDDRYNDWLTLLDTIRAPTIEETFVSITRSTKLYWSSDVHMKKIKTLLTKLDPVQRAAVIYSGDFWTVRNLNPEYVRVFLSKFTEKKRGPIQHTSEALTNVDDEILNYIHHRFSLDIVDKGVDYSTYDPQLVNDMFLTAMHVNNVLAEYLDVFSTLFAHPNLPPVVYDIYNMMRDSVMMSDTDSGANTLQEWVQWYYGTLKVTEDAIALSNSLVYLNGVVTKVYIKVVNKNINMSNTMLDANVIQFKNEFTWIVFGLMSISKHYFAGVNIREGNVFKRKLEIKGGSLKSNSIPIAVKDVAYDKLMVGVLADVEVRGKVSFYEYIDKIISLELSIYDDIHGGGHTYLRKLTINEPSAYKLSDPLKNNYQHCVFWNSVFGDSVNYTVEAPYGAYKYPTTLKSATKIKAWVATIEDTQIRERLASWLVAHNKSALNIIYLPIEYVKSYPIPSEVTRVIDTRRIILDLCNLAYIVLESLAYYKPLGLTLYEIFPQRAEQLRTKQEDT